MRLLGIGSSGVTPEDWRKSSYSYVNGDCIEVARNMDGLIRVRDSKNPSESLLAVGRVQWDAFIDDVRNGKRYHK